MLNAVEILDQGFACLVEHMGVVDAEYFISLIKRDDFDYTISSGYVLSEGCAQFAVEFFLPAVGRESAQV